MCENASRSGNKYEQQIVNEITLSAGLKYSLQVIKWCAQIQIYGLNLSTQHSQLSEK